MNNRVALIAYSVRFPGTDTQRFWGDLLAQKDLVTGVDPTRWCQDTFLHPDKRHPGTSYSFAAGSIGDISGFDAAFFGISPREATLIDPQQRILLELVWETFENAGIIPSSLRGSDCGVYIGVSNVDYAYRMLDDLAAIEAAAATGIISSIAANRISYVFDLHGPSISMDTACSSSLVAFHQACQAIRSGEISLALAGGINLHLHPCAFVSFSKATMLSKSGHCQVFGENADGYVRSEGGGLFLLKNYDQAIADNDQILAVVAGSAINTDGHKTGLTIPNPLAQAALMAAVYEKAGIDPGTIDYFEAHGTGTAVGDPIETHAIGLALGQKRTQPLLIGSVKSNLGHLESASGVAGLAKALNCLKHRAIPATISAKKPNPNIKFADWNIRVVTDTLPLKAQGELTIGINSFGFGGANAHVILQSPPTPKPLKKSPGQLSSTPALPLILSAKDQPALQQSAQELADFIAENPGRPFYDLAHSAFFNRERHPHGIAVFAATPEEAIQQFKHFANQQSPPDKNQATAPRAYKGTHLADAKGPAFVYSGNGCQWQGMGKQLLEQSPVFRRAVSDVDALFQNYADFSLLDELAGRNGAGRYQRTEIAQPALFALQVGITEVLREHGFQAAAVIGHSVGEVAAAWASGALSLAAAVKVIYYRSHHQGKTQSSGGMTAVGLNAEDMGKLLADSGLDEVCLAGVNSHRGVTIAGDVAQLSQIESQLAANNTFFKRLDLDYAFHSPAMDTIEAGVLSDLAELAVNEPAIPFFSTVTGDLLLADKLDAQYWWHNIRKPVQFDSGVNALLATGINTLVEIGAHTVLQAYLHDCLKAGSHNGIVVPTIKRNNDTAAQLLNSTAQLMIAGVEFNHKRWFPVTGQFIGLPNYPWQREKLWHPVTSESQGLLYRTKNHPLLGYALKQHALIWENQLDTQSHPFLADHNVGGAVVFPGAGFAELALAAAHQAHASDFIEIEDLEIRSPLLLSHDHSKVIRFSLDAADGRFNLQSRELGKASEWLQHSLGRVLGEATGYQLALTAPELPNRAPDFDQHSHAQLTDSVGLEYGAAFQAIRHGWVDGDSALGVFAIPDTILAGFDRYYLHPSLLDCAFQLVFQILKDELHQHDDIAFVPVKIGRLHVRSSKAVPVLAKASLLHRGSHSLKAEFVLYDAQGQAIAVVHDARFRAVRLHKAQVQALSFLDYHLTASPLLAADSPLGLASNLVSACISATDRDVASRRYTSEVEPLLDSLSQQFIAEALGSFADGQGLLSSAWFAGHCHDYPGSAELLRTLLSIATDNQSLFFEEGLGWQLSLEHLENDIPATAIWNTLIQDYPDYFYLTHLAGRVGMQLDRLLRCEIDANELGVNPTHYALISNHIFERTQKKILSDTLLEQYAEMMRYLPAGQRLRILEISAHAPQFAPLLCPQLDFNQADYCFAGLCDRAINVAAGLREHFPLLHSFRWNSDTQTNRLALDKPANFAIIHLNSGRSQDVQEVLGQLSGLLLPGSPVWIVGLHPVRWIDAVLGIAPDWWPSHSAHVQMSPQLLAKDVANQLQTLGFSGINTEEKPADSYSGTYLLTAQSADSPIVQVAVNPQNWLILADPIEPEQTLAQSLAGQLRKQGQQVFVAQAGHERLPALLADAQTINSKAYDHIIHLSGFGQDDAQIQTGRCWLAACIIRACEGTATDATIWLLTSQVAALFVCDQSDALAGSLKRGAIAHDAALWGFGRCLMNEASNYRVQLLDINGDTPAVSHAVITELLHGDAEQEVVLNQHGKRFAARLRSRDSLVDGKSLPDPGLGQEPTLRLSFKLPGQLRNLQWQAVPTRTPSEDEIEIEVKATGLNFRDVMYTLGLLSDEAVENGFVGPTLGLEFAGLVTRIGTNVHGFKPGDKVVGLGPASFSNRVLTKANAITQIPEHLDYAAAATIPSTFFTVYYALHYQARLQAGEKVLIHGAAGGVGIAAIQIAVWLGAEIYATVGSDDKRDFLRLLGIKHIYDSRSLRFAEEILAETDQRGVDVVLNSLAGEAINRNFQVLKPFGRFLELGKRDFYENTHIGLRPFRNNISYFGIDADQLMQERPELTQKLFADMMELFHNGVLHPLPYTTFDANQVVDAFRYMQQSKQIGKIVVTYQHGIQAKPTAKHPPLPSTVNLSSDKCYFVTGGLSGFGLRSAQWLVEKGAKHLILISRTGAKSSEAKTALAAFAAQGVNVHAAAVDVTDKTALTALLTYCGAIMPPLSGIIHAAAVIDDSLARNLTKTQLAKVLEPKIQGALNLHELTRDKPLDFFVLYSSVTTLFGNPGQSNYVAANCWLEALAASRRQLGLPVNCIGWGAIDDVGFLARNEKIKEALQNRLGGAALSSELALAQLDTILQTHSPTVAIMAFDWRNLSSFLPSSRSPKFLELAAHAPNADQGDDHDTDIKRLLEELPDDALKATFIEMLKEELGQILLVNKDKIDANHSMYDMGLDSLMGVELMIAIESRFRVQIPVMVLSDASSLSKLADHLIGHLRGGPDSSINGNELQATIHDVSKRHDLAFTAEQTTALTKELENHGTSRIIT
ncbi:MAG: type I polyketide synthase [Methylovulum sp.]|uniref:type I polyketide synthase n=1 Tax=Methylovulum sp. TaxID=1916980 RepID=UPI00262134F2|nr:type I polyketide synthase [Methylovulum sp.]MDD2723244.1 type I polyketide synthase [Methylovulum sp.]MDD5123435.1 type I polyketide synthase [Methylovulum sp.]